jgi:hypothetical protein
MARLRYLSLIGGAALAVAAFGAMTAAQAQTPQSVCSVLSGRPCHPSFCSIFHRGPCQPYYLPPLGEDLQLTIVSSDDNDHAQQSGDTGNSNAVGQGNTDDHDLDSISAMFAALRACWVPPPKDEARHGMQYTIRFAFKTSGEIIAPPRVTYASHDAPAQVRDTYRDAIDAALKRCTPLHFTEGMSGAIAGRPIAIRYVDNRTIDASKSLQYQISAITTATIASYCIKRLAAYTLPAS